MTPTFTRSKLFTTKLPLDHSNPEYEPLTLVHILSSAELSATVQSLPIPVSKEYSSGEEFDETEGLTVIKPVLTISVTQVFV